MNGRVLEYVSLKQAEHKEQAKHKEQEASYMAKIGIIGIGNMGSAILKGLLHVYGKGDIIFTDVNEEKCE